MPMQAERQKLYRARLKQENPKKYEAFKKKNAERTNRNRKRINDCQSVYEQDEMRKKWREDKRKAKEKTPIEVKDENKERQKKINKINYKMKKENLELKFTVTSMNKEIRKLRKRLNRMQRNNDKLIEYIQELKNENSKIKVDSTISYELTPSTKASDFIDQNLPNISLEEKKKVQKRLLEHNVLVDSLKQCYQSAESNSKRIIKSFVDCSIVDKYKMKGKMAKYLGLTGKIRRIQTKKRNYELLNKLKDFFERDDVSRATAGKKEFKTFRKDKRQRRYLLDTLENLFKKYKSEGGKGKLTTFKKYRPFYILPPKISGRETCACIKHENILMKAKVLKSLGLIESQSFNEILSLILCDPKSKECSYEECPICKNKSLEFNLGERNLEDSVRWQEWSLQTHEYKDKGSESKKTTKRTIKNEKTGPLKDLVDAFTRELTKFKKHAYNITHQYMEHQRCIKNLNENTVAIHVDFSENYATKLNTEIQAVHFGASRNQITLHTGLIYSKERDPLPFCSISANNYHGPEAIWEHLTPILDYIKNYFCSIDTVHFFSDGPTSQYRQKKNFYFFASHTKRYGFKATWNFFEASHGKGAADGIGGTLKRKMDSLVAYGSDIKDAETAYELLTKSGIKIKLFYIPENSIQMQKLDLIPVPGTMTLHQIISTNSNNTISYRSLSCFCSNLDNEPGFCNCLDLQRATLTKEVTPTKKIEKQKITILSDIKNTLENKAYFDLRQFGPFSLKSIKPEAKLLCANNVENIPEDGAVASCSKTTNKEKRSTAKRKMHKVKRSRINCDSSTDTEIDEPYSLHNSSDDEYFISEDEDERELMVMSDKTKKNKTDNDKEHNELEEMTRKINNDSNIECDQNTNQRENTYTINVKDMIQDINIESDLSQSSEKNTDSIETHITELNLNLNDVVLVRYYEKKAWKYYIGCIENINVTEKETLYTVLFLKTLKKPQLHFVYTKKIDRDIITADLIVKKLVLIQNPVNCKEYLIENDDNVYFDD